jgi:hypothetical protein
MALHDRLFNEIRNTCTGITDASLQQALWETLDDACRDAWIWRETLDVTMIAGEDVYPVVVPGAEVVHGLNISHPTMDTTSILWDDTAEVLVLTELLPTANDVGSGPLLFTAVLAPSLPSGTVPADPNPVPVNIDDWIPPHLWDLLHQTLACGMKERLMAMPAKPWGNAQLAAYWHRCYRSHKAVEKRRAYVGNQRNVQTWAFPTFLIPSRRK